METRKGEQFKVKKANSDILIFFAIIYMQYLLKKNKFVTKDKIW